MAAAAAAGPSDPQTDNVRQTAVVLNEAAREPLDGRRVYHADHVDWLNFLDRLRITGMLPVGHGPEIGGQVPWSGVTIW